ncbi:MAG: TonB-dependent receptor, partial [Bacteroidales bacterium]|nr:TonB-dependent receptor [Bacteroidales bacterium]
KYTFSVAPDATLVFSFVGYRSQEIPVAGKSVINVTMTEETIGLKEVVAVGYGTQKRVNLTGAVSTTDKEVLENRPLANVQQALQGLVPNLNIAPTVAGGEPGSDMSMNIRGLTSFEGSNNPYVLVDGIPMGINDIDPNDIESISVLKDAASSAIYGARAAYGVILITTKKGQKGARISYGMNYGASSPTIWPEIVQGIEWAYALNEAKINAGGSPYYDDDALNRLAQNLVEPGSAPAMLPTADSLDWDIMNTGTKGVANDNLTSLIVNRYAPMVKHNLSISGGNEKINYYVSGAYFYEKGLLKFGNEAFNRYNVDAKISAQATSWMKFSFLSKFRRGHENFPWNQFYGRAWIMNWIGKLKPGTPAKYPGTDIWTKQTRVEEWKNMRQIKTNKQFVISPRIILEPLKGWVTNIELNYKANQDEDIRFCKQYPWVRPTGEIAYVPQNQSETQYRSNMTTNTYVSPNIYSTYTTTFGSHNLRIMAGYQQEAYEYSNLYAQAFYLLSNKVPSLSTSVGEKTIDDGKGHWATQSVFGRLNYNFSEKYLLEVNVRADGSSRFEEGKRWGVFPSVSAGWVISKENFFSLQDQIDLLKLRASYGVLGNQNVANYLYIPNLPIRQTNYWLFANERAWVVGTPNLTSIDLTWEKVATYDLGVDLGILNNRLGLTFDAYESHTTDLVGPGQPTPAVLGTSVPKKNEGEIRTRGWELELSWKNRVSPDFNYELRAVLSDHISTVVHYNNPTKLLNRYYDGEVLGEIWGLETAGLYQDQEDIESYGVDQSYIYSGTWFPGDMKYVDQNGDGKIDIGDNTKENHGDKKIIGNSTPRYVYGFNARARWKGFDFSILLQGIAKRDLDLRSAVFRGPSAGPMHNNVLKGHLDYWRDETSPLGANPDAYFPRPYAQYWGQNQKNYSYPTDHFLQNGAFLRLKNFQIGYTLPGRITQKISMSSARLYLSGENLLTFTKLMFFDPEAFAGRWYGAGDAYPLSKTWSIGLNVNF